MESTCSSNSNNRIRTYKHGHTHMDLDVPYAGFHLHQRFGLPDTLSCRSTDQAAAPEARALTASTNTAALESRCSSCEPLLQHTGKLTCPGPPGAPL